MNYKIENCRLNHDAYGADCAVCTDEMESYERVIHVPVTVGEIGRSADRVWCHARCMLFGRTFYTPNREQVVIRHVFWNTERDDEEAVQTHDDRLWPLSLIEQSVML